jgi:predicted aldo/keto reductase-like oxidoreductase
MLYRKLGNAGLNVSVLGFGAMSLPFLCGITAAMWQDSTNS